MVFLDLVVVLLLAPLAGCGAQILVFRLGLNRTIAGSVAIGFGIGALVLFLGIQLSEEDWNVLRLMTALVVYCCAGYTYFHLNNMGETARRVRLVIELLKQPEGMTYREITELYNSSTQVERRIARLLSTGDIIDRGGILFLERYRYLILHGVFEILRKGIILAK